jgi:hypothetical protein
LAVDEIRLLCKYAGFDIKRCIGIWLCEHPSTGKLLKLEQMSPLGPMRMKRRIELAKNYPEQSFIWWIEGIFSKNSGKPVVI